MNPDPFESTTIALVCSWAAAIPAMIAVVALPFSIFKGEARGYRMLIIWFFLCSFALSPARYLLFLAVAGSSYVLQSWGAFFSCFALIFYIPIVFTILYVIGFSSQGLAAIAVVGKRETISFGRGIAVAVVIPIACLISKYLFYLVLPAAAWTIHWLNPSDVIKSTNGPTAFVFRYVTLPFSQIAAPDIFYRTPLTHQDLLRCHVANSYMGGQAWRYFIKKQYPQIYAEEVKKMSK